jgi:vancomycin permeability regulator SanA
VVSGPWLWTTFAALPHVHDADDAPAADVVLVLGTEVGSDRLASRLRTAAELVRTGKARVVLVSGDGAGESGDEPAAMTAFLVGELGLDAGRVVADPFGLDTYDSCARARDVYGVTRALVVTQSYHVSRAVTLCRHLGVDADGVAAPCAGCGATLVAGKWARDYVASGKAARDAVSGRPPAISSPPDPAVRNALRA